MRENQYSETTSSRSTRCGRTRQFRRELSSGRRCVSCFHGGKKNHLAHQSQRNWEKVQQLHMLQERGLLFREWYSNPSQRSTECDLRHAREPHRQDRPARVHDRSELRRVHQGSKFLRQRALEVPHLLESMEPARFTNEGTHGGNAELWVHLIAVFEYVFEYVFEFFVET